MPSNIDYQTDEQKVDLYRSRVNKSEKWCDEKWRPTAKRLLRRYNNESFAEEFTQKGHKVNVPVGVSVVDTMYASLTAVDVRPVINLKGHGTQDMARLVEQATTHEWDDCNVPEAAQYTIKENLIIPISWVKVGYDFADHDEVQPKEPEELRGEIRGVYEQAMREGKPPPDAAVVTASIPPTKVVTIVDRDRIVVDHVDWDGIVWDHIARKYEDIRWVAQISKVPIYEVQENERFREYCKKRKTLKRLDELKADSHIDKEFLPDGVEPTEDDDRITLIEFHNLEAGTICWFTKDGGDFLLDETESPFGFNEDMHDRNPFVPLVLRAKPNSVIGISDMELIEPSILELARYRSALLNHLERHVPKLLAKQGALTATGKEQLSSPDPEMVELAEGYESTDVQPLEPPPLLSEAFQMEERVDKGIRDATGASEIQRGLFPDRRRTATETVEVVAASAARQAEKRTKLEQFYTNIAKRMIQLMQVYYDTERITRIVEIDGDVEWSWKAEDITTEMDIKVELAPKIYQGPAEREERAMKLVNFVGALPIVDQISLAKHALQEMGYPMQVIREILKLPEEQQVDEQQELQREANAAVAAEGGTVSPASVPGPLTGEEVAQAANPGEIPPELQQPAEDAAAVLEGESRPGTFVPGI